MNPFVHLHCHSDFSLLDGASQVPALVKRVKSLGMNACALTDHGNMYGAIAFYSECKAAGVNPVVGIEAYVAPGKMTEKDKEQDNPFHLTLLCQNEVGFKNLIKLTSASWLVGFYRRPRIDLEILEAHRDGIICLSGCASSEFGRAAVGGELERARVVLEKLSRLFGDRFYVEVQNNGLKIQGVHREVAYDLAGKLGLPLVATSDAHYLTREDAFPHDLLLCINTDKVLNDPKRIRYGDEDEEGNVAVTVNQFHVCSQDEMYERFKGKEEAVRRSQEIADRCNLELDFKKRHFPIFVPETGQTPEEFLRELCWKGAKERYGETLPDEVTKRLTYELDVVCRMGFATYFLVVWDFVRFAVEKGIPCGARGSAAGAIVSYVLKFSHIDPLEYELLFERFLDPNRKEAPDIDIDFCQRRREEVITYVMEKYGENSVAQIATFGRMGAKQAIKDVGKALGAKLSLTTRLADMIPHGPKVTLAKVLKLSPDLKKAMEAPDVKQIIDAAVRLEGTNRQAGVHAAGIVITPGDLTDYVPLHRQTKKQGGAITTQWVMGDIEKAGLLKMDFLGLRTLTVLDECVKLIRKERGIRVLLQKIPKDDKWTFRLLQSGDCKGVFQMEEVGIQKLLKRLKPDRIADITACTALYRPGPLEGGMVASYVERKHGREAVQKVHPIMDKILEETYGVMVFQENVMRILNVLGGISLSDSYKAIKAISKKKQDEIDKYQAAFVAGAVEREMGQEKAEEVFSQIAKFGSYGFNLSHSASYAWITYQTAFLKANFPAEFMAAVLSSEEHRPRLLSFIRETRRMGLKILPPDVNSSYAGFGVTGGKITFGLASIHGVSAYPINEIVRGREKGKFKSVADFCTRIVGEKVGRFHVEKLIKAGAFDGICEHRAQGMSDMDAWFSESGTQKRLRKNGQTSIFDWLEEEQEVKGKEVAEWTDKEKMQHERDALDFYFSGHPMAKERNLVRKFARYYVSELNGKQDGVQVSVGGVLVRTERKQYKKPRDGNTHFGLGVIEDQSGECPVTVWGNVLKKCDEVWHAGQIVIIEGVIERKEDGVSINAHSVIGLTGAMANRIAEIHLMVRKVEEIEQIGPILRAASGETPVVVTLVDEQDRKCVCTAGKVDRAKIDLNGLRKVLGDDGVDFVAR